MRCTACVAAAINSADLGVCGVIEEGDLCSSVVKVLTEFSIDTIYVNDRICLITDRLIVHYVEDTVANS